ncbi:hypothetical protein BV25DRAFT_494990 [Artomyces pyxidatus]|uniref:Uncharacterized protein n=1 Tax=Artomyces pyxidatus TaxID=48021 RepID=A0ACB8T4T6_9AGAM|nr:hypothetical protein BV25DRAFT_494990 [Artomyces pyxidatus]
MLPCHGSLIGFSSSPSKSCVLSVKSYDQEGAAFPECYCRAGARWFWRSRSRDVGPCGVGIASLKSLDERIIALSRVRRFDGFAIPQVPLDRPTHSVLPTTLSRRFSMRTPTCCVDLVPDVRRNERGRLLSPAVQGSQGLVLPYTFYLSKTTSRIRAHQLLEAFCRHSLSFPSSRSKHDPAFVISGSFSDLNL